MKKILLLIFLLFSVCIFSQGFLLGEKYAGVVTSYTTSNKRLTATASTFIATDFDGTTLTGLIVTRG